MKLFSIFAERKRKMQKHFKDSRNYIRLIRYEEKIFENILIRYRFYEIVISDMKTQYAIAISTDTDECFASVGDNREAALFLCEAVISGGVTPCTLHDIVSDSRKEEYYLY